MHHVDFTGKFSDNYLSKKVRSVCTKSFEHWSEAKVVTLRDVHIFSTKVSVKNNMYQ